MDGFYNNNYEVYSFNCDESFKLKVSAMVDFLQDIAMRHSDNVGCGYEEMRKMGYAWILYKWKIRIYELPCLGDILKVTTWSSGIEKKQAYRSFRVYDNSGKMVCEALSIWLVLDIGTHSICSIPPEVSGKYIDIPERIFEKDFTNNPLSLSNNELSANNYTIRRHDLDYNNHVNNARYVELFWDTIPYDMVKNSSAYDLEVIYKKECILDSVLDCICFDTTSDENSVIGIIKESDTDSKRHSNSFFKLVIM